MVIFVEYEFSTVKTVKMVQSCGKTTNKFSTLARIRGFLISVFHLFHLRRSGKPKARLTPRGFSKAEKGKKIFLFRAIETKVSRDTKDRTEKMTRVKNTKKSGFVKTL